MFLCFYDHLAPKSLEHAALRFAPSEAEEEIWRVNWVRAIPCFVFSPDSLGEPMPVTIPTDATIHL